MCFPSKRQKDNFTDESTKKSNNQKGWNGKDIKEPTEAVSDAVTTSAPTASSTAPAHPPATMSPRIAIVIYTMYQHVGNSTLVPVLCLILYLSFFVSPSGSGCQTRHRKRWWQCTNFPVSDAIVRCQVVVDALIELPKHSLQRSSIS